MFVSFESCPAGLAASYWGTQGCFRAAVWIILPLQISIWESADYYFPIFCRLLAAKCILAHPLSPAVLSGDDLGGRWFPPPHEQPPAPWVQVWRTIYLCNHRHQRGSLVELGSAWCYFKQWDILSWAEGSCQNARAADSASGYCRSLPLRGSKRGERNHTSAHHSSCVIREVLTEAWPQDELLAACPLCTSDRCCGLVCTYSQLLMKSVVPFLCHVTPFEAVKHCSDPSVEDGVQGTGVVYPPQRWLPLCILCLWVPVLRRCR